MAIDIAPSGQPLREAPADGLHISTVVSRRIALSSERLLWGAKLQVVFAEGGISWVPPALQDAEVLFDTFGNGDIIEKLEHRPSHYWHNNCYATFQNDPLGIRLLDVVGAERVMWATDYPHSEGSFGFGRSSVKAIVDATTPDQARAILGGNAAKVFNLEN